MEWSSIIYAAIGGAIGGGLGALLARQTENATLKALFQVLPVLLALPLMSTLYDNMYLPRLFLIDDTELLETLPSFSALKENDPEFYKEILSTMDPVIRKGELTPESLTPLRHQFYAYLFEKTASAPIAALRLQNEIGAKQYKELEEIDPAVCTAQAHGRPFRNLDGVLSEELAVKEQDFMVSVIANKTKYNVGDKVSGEEIFNAIIAEQVQVLGILNADPKPENKVANEKMCQLLATLSLKVNELEDEKVRDVAAYTASANQN